MTLFFLLTTEAQRHRGVYLLLLLLLFAGCHKKEAEPPSLISVNIVDNNGLSEIVTSKDRLEKLEGTDFLAPLPYKKVMRIYSRNEKGEMTAFVTTYWPNGHPKQYLEIVNGRAYGTFSEWHENGKIKAESFVIGGEADTSESALRTFLFEGEAAIWAETGELTAQIHYCKGRLHGESLYFHSNGSLWKKIPYTEGKIEGPYQIFRHDETLLLEAMYVNDEPSGACRKYWEGQKLAVDELWDRGRLMEGQYWSKEGELLSSLCLGTGERITFGKNCVHQKQHYEMGVPVGRVETYTAEGKLYSTHIVLEGMKEGEEIFYYPSSPPKPALSISWSKDQIQGTIKSWYPSGLQESQKELALNKKNGLLSAWYRDGSLMIIEEYQEDRLIKGDYFRKGELSPVSTVKNGKGKATLFDSEGRFLRKIEYDNGFPLSD